MYEIPQSVEVNGQSYAIRNRGDYRMVLDCFEALTDIQLSEDERIYSALIIFYDGFESIEDIDKFGGHIKEAIQSMYEFFNCGRPEANDRKLPVLYNWKQDSQLISAAVNKVAGKEVRSEKYIHWWTFMGYFMSIGQSSFATVIGIRNKITKGNKLDKWEQEFRRDNPQYFVWDARSTEEKELDELAFNLWNSGS